MLAFEFPQFLPRLLDDASRPGFIAHEDSLPARGFQAFVAHSYQSVVMPHNKSLQRSAGIAFGFVVAQRPAPAEFTVQPAITTSYSQVESPVLKRTWKSR